MAYDLNKLAKLQAVNDAAVRLNAKIEQIKNTGVASAIKSVDVDGNALKFFTSTDTTSTAAFTVDLPAEIFLDAATTTFVPNFEFSSATYVGATDPQLEGKPVLVLGVKTKSNDGQTTTLAYSFIDMHSLVDIYTASDTSVIISDYKVKANVSSTTGNMLATTAAGLYVDGSGKVDKVTGASEGNLATFVTGGGVSDTGISIATNAEVTEMLDSILGSAYKSVSLQSTSDFLSTDTTTFRTFLQNAYDAMNDNDKDEFTAISFQISDSTVNGEQDWYGTEITYGEVATLLQNNSATIHDFLNLVNQKIAAEDVGIEASYDETKGLTFTNTSGTADTDTVAVTISEGTGDEEGAGHLILESLYNGASDKSAFTTSVNGGGTGTAYTLSLQSA